MPIQMTRAEYEAKYGQKPSISPIQSNTPIKMTRAEYEAKYGVPVGETPSETEGVWDAVKTGFSNAKQSIVSSGEELADVLDTQANPFVKTAKAATTLIKAPIKVGAELAIATPARMIGEGIESTTGYDINEAVSQGTKKLVQKGMDTETAKKAMEGWAKLKETDPESAMALSAVLDIGDIAANVIGLGAEKAAVKTAVGGAIKGAVKTGEKVAEVGARVGEKVSGGVMPIASRATEFGVSQTFGLKPETIRNIVKNPDLFTPEEMASFDKHSISNKVFKAVDKLENEYGETGKAYESVRNTTGKVNVPKTAISDVLNKYGIQLDEAGKIVHTENSVPMSTGDINQLQNWIDTYAKTEVKNANQFMNARQASGKIANFNAGTTDVADRIGRDIYAKLNEIGRPQIKGLAELDAKYSPLRDQYKTIKKDYFDKFGNLKDNAYSKLFNLTGKNKERVLARVEKIAPGITEDLNILKSMEDIAAAGSNKVGTYTRTIMGTGGGALLGGLPGAVVGMILTSPQMGVKLIRTYGKLKNIKVDGVINKMKAGKKLVGAEIKMVNEAVDNAAKNIQEKAKKLKPGMIIEDVSKKGSPTVGKTVVSPLIQEARKYKSAEEFVKAKTNAYHGTPNKEFSEFKMGVGNNTENETNGLGVWVTNSPEAAKNFSKKIKPSFMGIGGGSTEVGGTVMPVSVQLKNPKVFNSTKGMDSILIDIEKLKKEKPSLGRINFTSDPVERHAIIESRNLIDEKISKLQKEYQRDAFEHFMDDRDQFAKYINNGAKWEDKYIALDVPKTNKQYVEYLKKQGYDGIIIKGTKYDAKSSGKEAIDQIVSFDPKNVLTKSQLTDIWNKSQPLQEGGSLIQEARKGIKIYHGSAKENIDALKKGIKIYTPEEKLKFPSTGGGNVGISMTTDKATAHNYSAAFGNKEVGEFTLNPNAKIKRISTYIDDTYTPEQLEKLQKEGYDAIISGAEEKEVRILSEKAISQPLQEGVKTGKPKKKVKTILSKNK